jgi:hypothetical protein
VPITHYNHILSLSTQHSIPSAYSHKRMKKINSYSAIQSVIN